MQFGGGSSSSARNSSADSTGSFNVGAEAHRLIKRAVESFGAREPDFNLRITPLDDGNHFQFFAEQTAHAQNQRGVILWLGGQFDHRGIGIVDFNAGASKPRENRARRRPRRRRTDEQRASQWSGHRQTHARHMCPLGMGQ
jgi:hypothetical protein